MEAVMEAGMKEAVEIEIEIENGVESAPAIAGEAATVEVAAVNVPPATLISSLLFVAPRPISFERLLELSELSTDEVEAAIEDVKQLFNDDVHGFSLHEVSGGFQFRSAPQVAAVIKRMVPARTKRLSRAAGETLAVIAYKQPVERAEIEAIRGVDALPTLKTLIDAKLMRVIGKHDSPGHPVLYGTTAEFLERFGLTDLSALPTLHEFEQLASDPGESSNELGGESDSDFADDETIGSDIGSHIESDAVEGLADAESPAA